MLTEETKKSIASDLKAFVSRYRSQSRAAAALKGVSAATLSCLLNGKWDLISDDMWLRVRSQAGKDSGWTICRTNAFSDMMTYLSDSQDESSVTWVVAPAGSGKSTAAQAYAAGHANVYTLLCSEDMHRADFIHELASATGVRTAGMTVRECLHAIIRHLVTLDAPLLVFDEGDKLNDSVLYYFISLYNALEGYCGMVFLSTSYMEQRVRRGVAAGKKGYDELDSRISRRFVPLSPVSAEEVRAICEANGLTDKNAVASVVSDVSRYGFDLRRVRKAVHKELRKAEIRSNAAQTASKRS